MPFEFRRTEINDVYVITPHIFSDKRGIYLKHYEKNIYASHGIICDFIESSDLYSVRGALRGLHYQTIASQAKLIHVVSGSVFDVALDLRKNSETFGKFHVELLTGDNHKVIYIPEGFAHGYIALEDNTVFSYQSSGRYIPESCGGIRWNDPELNIPWPLKEYGIKKIIVTKKDANWPTLSEYVEKMNHCEDEYE